MKPFSYLVLVLTLACIAALALTSIIGCASEPALARTEQTAQRAEANAVKVPLLSPQDSTLTAWADVLRNGFAYAKAAASARASVSDKSRTQDSTQAGSGNVQTNDQSERPLDKRLLYILGAISLCSTYPVYRLFEVVESRVGYTLWRRRIDKARSKAHDKIFVKDFEPSSMENV